MKKLFVLISILGFSIFFYKNISASTVIYAWQNTIIEVNVNDSIEAYLDLPKCSVIDSGSIQDVTINYYKDYTYFTLNTVKTHVVGVYYLDYCAEVPKYSYTSKQRITFNVVDKVPPVISITNKVIELYEAIDLKKLVVASDNYSKSDKIQITIDSKNFLNSQVGVYEMRVLAIDESLNEATSILIVEVVDNGKPSIIAKEQVVYINYGSSNFNIKNYYEAYDNYDDDISHKMILLSSINYYALGEQNIRISVKDNSNNEFIYEGVVYIVDTILPNIKLSKYIDEIDDYNILNDDYFYSLITSVSDNQTDLTIDDVFIDTNELTNAKGQYNVYYSVSDGSSNTFTATLKITINSVKIIEVLVSDIYIKLGENFDFNNYIEITKEANVEYYVSVVNHNVNIFKAGNYKIDVLILDSNNNKIDKTINVFVTENVVSSNDSKLKFTKNDLYFIVAFIGLGIFLIVYIKKSGKKSN